MRKQLVLIIPILSHDRHVCNSRSEFGKCAKYDTPESNMTGGTNATMGGNMTSGNATSGNMADPLNITTP